MNNLEEKAKTILVLGGGVSGVAAAAFLRKKGASVTLADEKTKEQVSESARNLETQGVTLHLGGMPEVVDGYDYAVISPGIPLDVPIAQRLQAAGIPIIGELELAYRFSHNPYLAITGTNGKTTTTSLVGYILELAKIPCLVGGNIGTPLVEQVEALPEEGYIVAEVSSFQLETVRDFRPRAAAYLNLTPDHLNRHHTMENYGRIKARIFANQQPGDTAVLNADDAAVRRYAEGLQSEILWFSRRQPVAEGFFVRDGGIFLTDGKEEQKLIDIDEIFIKGGHNVENAMAAAALTYAVGVEPEVIRRALIQFRGVAHRQEYVREKDGVLYINDSKGTNPDSTLQALLAYDRPMVLILGGYDKKGDFDSLMPLIKEKVRHVVLVGETAPQIQQMLERNQYTAYTMAGRDFAKAVTLASEFAESGDVVMLSPACASWDMFRRFEDRGNLFKELVRKL